jgi:hypothetical protein
MRSWHKAGNVFEALAQVDVAAVAAADIACLQSFPSCVALFSSTASSV